jgi:hypothetical protein
VRSVAVRDQTLKFEGALGPQGPDPSGFSRREYLAVHLAHCLGDAPFRLTDEFLEELKEEFTDGEIIEMIFACALFSWGNIVGIATRVECAPESDYPELPWESEEGRKLRHLAEGRR